MASMVIDILPTPRRFAARLAMAALLLTPAMCMANELSPQQREYYRVQLGLGGAATSGVATNAAAEAIIEWQALRQANNPGFDRLATFLLAHPGWPDEAALRRKADTALAASPYVPPSAIAYFTRFAPENAAGHARFAMALLAAGRADEAAAEARRAWLAGAMSPDDETRILSNFPGLLSSADQDARMERLLWTNSASVAARQLNYVSAERRLEFTARLAMRGEAADAAIRAAEAEGANPRLTRENPGYIFNKARWLAATGQAGAARILLSAPRELTSAPVLPETWLELLLAQARGAINAGDSQTAYAIAQQSGDALPVGAAILEQDRGVRDDYTSLVWLAADTALRRLHRPADAARLFATYADGGRSPQVQARGLYWAGRAAQDAGNAADAAQYWTRAAAHFDQFHGQLALERLGQAQPRPSADAVVRFSAAERDAFNDNSLVQAARILGELGAWRDQSLFLRTIANNAHSDSEHYFGAILANEIGRPDLAVMIGRSARANGLDDYVPTAFPTVRVPAGYEDRWTFIHAISRQESQFDRAALSHAGARGLMQLMPGTAREQARMLGLAYDAGALTSDTNYNMQLGAAYFQRMLDYYGGSYPLAVAAYNAGPGNVNRWLASNGDPRTGAVDILSWIEAIPLSETRNYVQRVLENAVVYESIRPGANAGERNMLSRYLGKSQPG